MRAIHPAVSHDLGISGLASFVRFERYLNRLNPLRFALATCDSVFAAVYTVHNTTTPISQQPVIRSGRPFAHSSAPSTPSFRSLSHRDPCRIDRAAADSLLFRAFCHISATADPIDVRFCVPCPTRPICDLLEFHLDPPIRSASVAIFPHLCPSDHILCVWQLWCWLVCVFLHCSWISGAYRL